MRTGHAAGRTDESDLLSPLNGVTDCDKRFAEMEVASDDSGAVIDVNDVACQKKVVDERNDATVRGIHRLPYGAPEIDAEVAAGHVAVEETPGSKLTGDYRSAWATEGRSPHRRRIVRARADGSRPQILARYAGRGRGIEWASERAVDGQRRRHGRGELG